VGESVSESARVCLRERESGRERDRASDQARGDGAHNLLVHHGGRRAGQGEGHAI